MVPSDSTSHPRESFNRSAQIYDDHVAFNHAGAQRLIGALPHRDFPRVLDVACGTGFASLELIATRGTVSVTGIDASRAMLDQFAVKLAAHPGVEATLRAVDVLEMGVPAGSVDLVVCTMALHWFTDRGAAISEMAKTLRPGGLLAILGPGPGHDAQFVAISRSAEPPILPELADSIVNNQIYPEVMRAYLADAGLREIDLWVERRDRRVMPARYLDRMHAVASHLWTQRTPGDRDAHHERARSALNHASVDGIYEYTFTKLMVIAEKPVDGVQASKS